MFVIYMNDIKPIFKHSLFLLYADDLKCFIKTKLPTFQEDSSDLQSDLRSLQVWCNDNHLSINTNKSYVMSFTKGRVNLFDYILDGIVLVRVTRVRDLGVSFTNDFSFNERITETVSKATKSLGFIMRNASVFNKIITVKTLFLTLVRSMIEYACVIWSPFYVFNIIRLERVQNRFLRFAARLLNIPFDFYTHDYKHLRVKMNIPTLTSRFYFSDMSFLYRLLNGAIYCPSLLSMVNLRVPRTITRFNTLFSVPFHRTNYGNNSLIHRLCREANSIESDVDFFDTNALRFSLRLRSLLFNSNRYVT
ncbi:uncharacterized protein LOC122508276 [Leptopilina heterotoma]|uniref:uncharacterized protein LOC122508276 n=1 Tax=Leptopilina heterotoma TaxID=63436 RepID=UPI001CA849EB|nr:uncharacterized protein LOC122508276 [Leptopilina heterotoma]